MGFYKPTTTQTPDPIFDYWLTRLTGAEMRVLLYAVRRTYGFKKDDDNISLDQFEHGIRTEEGAVLDEGCGCSRKSILRAIKLLIDKGILIKTRRHDADRRDDVNNYRLHIVDERLEHPERGFRKVNTTQVPDEVFDHWLRRLSDAELFVLLYIVRRTLGFRKPADVISPEQFLTGVRTRAGAVLDDGCGVSKKHLYLALAGLKDKGLVAVQRRRSRRAGNIPSVYSLVFEDDVPGILSRSPDDLDPRAAAYDPHADAILIGAELAAPRVDDYGVPTAARRAPGGGPAGRETTYRGKHSDDKRGANGQREGRAMSPGGAHADDHGGAHADDHGGAHADDHGGAHADDHGGAHADDHGGAHGLHGGRTTTPGEGRADDQGYGSQSAPQQTANYQQTDKQETGHTQTDIKDDSISKSSRHRPNMDDPERMTEHVTIPQYSALISQRIADLSLLFHDQDHQRSNRTRALRLWAESNLGEQTFAHMVQEARLIAGKRGNIEKDAADGVGTFDGAKNRMPYFFAVLEDLVDMARDTGSAAQPSWPTQPGDGRGHSHADGPGPGPAMGMPTTRGVVSPGGDVSPETMRDSRGPGGASPGREPTAHHRNGNGGEGGEGGESDLWTAALDEVRLVVTPENYAMWLGSTRVVGRVGRVLRVAVPTEFHREWLTRKLQGKVMAALNRLGHAGLEIEYVVARATGVDGQD
jgi:hypothetical protein